MVKWVKIAAVLGALLAFAPSKLHALAIATSDLTVTTTIDSFSIDPVANGTTVFTEGVVLPDDPGLADTLQDIINCVIVPAPLPFGTATIAMGSASIDSVTASSGPSSTTQSMPTNASASFPGDAGIAVAATDGYMEIDNSAGLSAITVSITVDFGYSLSASITEFYEYAESLISQSTSFDIDGVEQSYGISEFSRVIADSVGDGLVTDAFTGSETFLITIDPGSTLEVYSISDSQSLATAVSEPSSLYLFAMMSGGVVMIRRRLKTAT